MAILNGFKGSAITGLAIGIGAALVAPALLPVLRTWAKPTAKALMKAGLVAYEQGRVALAEFGEVADDLLAEAKAELAAEQQASPSYHEAQTEPRSESPSTAPSQPDAVLPLPG